MAPLPPKQNGLFKKILKCYDYKQYKMGLKLAKQILSSPETANHGETLAMKGLILNCMGKKDEAYEYIRKGLRNDLTSHVCWHVYGLLQRSEHKYDEAIKCYRNALKYDKDNITILRDLSLLQIQMRDLEGFRDTRYQLFMLRSAQRVSWLSFAAAYHLLKDYNTAAKILDEFRRTQKQQKEQNSTVPMALPPSTQEPQEPQDTSKNEAISETKSSPSQTTEPIDYEQSELLLYQVMILQEGGYFKEALDFLNKNSSQICDRLAFLESKTESLLKLNRNAEAVKFIQDNLIARNQENQLYYQYLEKALNIDENDEVSRLVLYQNIQLKYPRSHLPYKIPLSFVNNSEKFTSIVDDYLKKAIRKCLPALFRNLRPVYNREYFKLLRDSNPNQNFNDHSQQQQQLLYDTRANDISHEMEKLNLKSSNSSKDFTRKNRARIFEIHGVPTKIRIIEDLVLSYEKNLKENESFDSRPETKNSENRTGILWVYYYLAQHYDFLGRYDTALQYVRTAIEHTPTLIDLLTLKGKIFKHMGEIEKAVEQVNEAQRLDTADRYLNSKCAKYFLRANKIEQAEELCAKFTRTGVSVTENLIEMQCMWFHIETANAYYRLKQYGRALKKCYEIDAFFSEVTEDQFDFHTYCMRKMTLREYIRLLRMEDILRSHKFYFAAAELAIKIYLHLHDEPLKEGKENKNIEDEMNQLSAGELKKIKSKERKAAAKQQQNQKHGNTKSHNGDNERHGSGKNSSQKSKNEPQQANAKQSQTTDGTIGNVDLAAELEKLERPDDPLEKAIRFLTPLKLFATGRIDTHLLAFEVYKRKNKILLMLQSVKQAKKINPNHEKLEEQMNQFMSAFDTMIKSGKLSKPIREVLAIEIPKLRGSY